ncbi:MAG: pantetheine-phosphate adenylyltransferase [Candidatus Levybacteria bacterium]|nr:pantetheine-phosphate adenylyltransferase [Candidatus Levybacteria bacterium]
MKFKVVVCGGTFDHFHKGHREFLRFALSKAEKLFIGVTCDNFPQNKTQNGAIQSYDLRKKSVQNFLRNEGVSERITVVKINDLYGNTLSQNLIINAIAVSQNTIEGAEIINSQRKKIGLSKLKILIYPMVLAEDKNPISSSRIRNGEINRDGRLFVNPLWYSHKLLLTEELRNKLKKPLGSLLKNGVGEDEEINNSFLAAVGDISVQYFNKRSLTPKISIIDFYVKRKKEFSNTKQLGFSGEEKVVKIKNPAGCLMPSIFKSLSAAFSSNLEKVIIKVEGEEDLCVLPLILLSPLGFVIFYGQPNAGLVKVLVSEEIKEKAYNIVNHFIPK